LVCVERQGFEAVRGCSGEGGLRDVYGKDVCVLAPPSPTPPSNEVNYVDNPCTDFFENGLCQECSGDCDSDNDCVGDLRCNQRKTKTGLENVPGCVWGADSDDQRLDDNDFCFMPTSEPGVINYVGECNSDGYLCGQCEGNCDGDSSCGEGLVCVERQGFEAVRGCSGEGGLRDVYGKDICAEPEETNFLDSLTYNEDGCNPTSPCSKCEGPCTSNSDCEDSSLTCFARSGSEPVPGCVTGGPGDISDVAYCHEAPTNGNPTYIPGDLTKTELGLGLSTGLTAKLIASSGQSVAYTGPGGGSSTEIFHEDPDAGAVFSVTSGTNAGGWIYASNSEESDGGVGAITFNANGEVINYEMILKGTSQNCGGGRTYWGTWITCEESGTDGQVWEVNPYVGLASQRGFPTELGGTGGNYESFAYEARDRANPTFYVTNDAENGGLTRFTPDASAVAAAELSGDYSSVLTTPGTLNWLVLKPDSPSEISGTFSWTSNRSEGDANANLYYQNSEGIDIRSGFLYFTTKRSKSLYILDLDNFTYTRSSTVSGAFEGQPDQIARILSEDPTSDMLYFCEEASNDNGIHARDSEGNFYTIINGGTHRSETTGLSFSPDDRHMYISYQGEGLIFDITREDGYPFGAHRLDIKYHNS
jgi:hypothetical protein